MKPSSLSSGGSQGGVALIITLFFLVLVSIVVVGFIDTARMDRVAAGSHFERMRAQNFANEGVETVIATLQRETCDPPYTTGLSTYVPRNWISQPGALVTTDPDGTSATRLAKTVPLSSGAPSAQFLTGTGIDLVLRPPDLNTELLVDQGTPAHLLSELVDPTNPTPNTVVKMKVRWVYVHSDGSYDVDRSNNNLPNEQPNMTSTYPIVGRFAYWTDDESAKINYNLAWTRGSENTNPPSHPTKINLQGLPQFTSAIADSLHGLITTDNYTTINRFFNSPFDARLQSDDATRAALDLNKFNLTHYNGDPDTTYYGLPRMMLTTQLSNAVVRDALGNVVMDQGKPVTRPFLDVLKNTGTNLNYLDPGTTANVDAAKLNTVVNNLIDNYLKRSDWPMVDNIGHSIQEKYYSLYPVANNARNQRLAQLALNIIDYVRSAESQLTVVQPIRAKWLPPNSTTSVFTPDFANTSIQGTEDTFKGLTRAPHITEMGMWVSDVAETSGPNIGRYRTVALVEVYLPANYGIDSIDLSGADGKVWQLYVAEMSAKDPADTSKPLYYLSDGQTAASNEYKVLAPKNTAVSSTGSPTFVWDAQTDKTKAILLPGQYRTLAMEAYRTQPKSKLGTASLRAAITLVGGPRIDVAPLATPLTYTLGGASSEMGVSSFETADPRVNGMTNDWKQSNTNTFGADNNARAQSLAAPMMNNGKAVFPPQDLDNNGNISTASLRMPPPYVTSKPQTGRVLSSGELGLVHTGIEGSSSAPQPGVPWRTLHLQPSGTNAPAASVVPDWAFMDLFTVPSTVPIAANALFTPHYNSAAGRVNMNAQPTPFDIQRVDPLAAVFNGALKSTLSATTVSADEAKTIAQNIYKHVLAPGGRLPAGKLYPANATANVYESPGEVVEIAGVADQGEESEQLVREVANLITARSNVFTVYTVGQALKQLPNGKLVVTGEQRQEAMIERYLVDKGTAVLTDDSVGLRVVYFRNLTP